MNCAEVRSRLGEHLDGRRAGSATPGLESHLECCPSCRHEHAALRNTQQLVAALGRRPAPPELALRIRLAVMQQRDRTFARRLRAYGVRVENALNTFMVPATAGLVTSAISFGLFVGFFAAPPPVPAALDVPTVLYMPPRLGSASVSASPRVSTGPIVVEISVDENGRLQDYRIVSGEDTPLVRRELDRSLMLAHFEPAISFGQPTPGRLVVTFDNVNVKG